MWLKISISQAWNKLMLDEADKYNIKKMFNLREIQNDISVITSVNSQANTNEMKAEGAPNYSLSNITSFAGSYPSFGLSGIGIVFIAEFISKNEKEGFYHVVAINLANNEVLFSERLRGEPGGLGFRNYWAGSVLEVILTIRKKLQESEVQVFKLNFG